MQKNTPFKICILNIHVVTLQYNFIKYIIIMKNKFLSTANFICKLSKKIFLYKDIWKQHTVALMQSPLDSDKTTIITDIIDSVAVEGQQVIYIDCDNRAECFVERFADNSNLSIFTPEYDDTDSPLDYADLVFEGIEEAVEETEVRTFIIDSLSRIAARSFGKNASPAYLMKRLVDLRARHDLSILIIAHSSTKSSDRALKLLSDCFIHTSEEASSFTQLKECLPTTELPEKTAPSPDPKPIPPARTVDKTDVANPVTEFPTPTVAAPAAAAQPATNKKTPKPLISNPFYHDSSFWHRPDPFD